MDDDDDDDDDIGDKADPLCTDWDFDDGGEEAETDAEEYEERVVEEDKEEEEEAEGDDGEHICGVLGPLTDRRGGGRKVGTTAADDNDADADDFDGSRRVRVRCEGGRMVKVCPCVSEKQSSSSSPTPSESVGSTAFISLSPRCRTLTVSSDLTARVKAACVPNTCVVLSPSLS